MNFFITSYFAELRTISNMTISDIFWWCCSRNDLRIQIVHNVSKRLSYTLRWAENIPGRNSSSSDAHNTQNMSACVHTWLYSGLHAWGDGNMNVVEHAVRCDMRTLEELHADRLWVTKYGWEERTNGSKKESNSVEL